MLPGSREMNTLVMRPPTLSVSTTGVQPAGAGVRSRESTAGAPSQKLWSHASRVRSAEPCGARTNSSTSVCGDGRMIVSVDPRPHGTFRYAPPSRPPDATTDGGHAGAVWNTFGSNPLANVTTVGGGSRAAAGAASARLASATAARTRSVIRAPAWRRTAAPG